MTRTMTVTPCDWLTGQATGPTEIQTSVVQSEVPSTPERVDTSPIPTGPVADVIAWVGQDVERATAALAAEVVSRRPRSSLTSALQDVIAPRDDSAGYDAGDRGTAFAGGVSMAEAPR